MSRPWSPLATPAPRVSLWIAHACHAWARMGLAVTNYVVLTVVLAGSVAGQRVEFEALRRVDERRAGQAGLRKVVGRHLRLYTDVRPGDAVDELPVVFDAAVQQWANYFGVSADRVRGWRVQAYRIKDRSKFSALGLLPSARPDFEHGFATDKECWLVEQPSEYYRRHLLLHEGTHAFMYSFLGSTGPGWYMEGMAELLGTHRWHDAELTLRAMPRTRAEAPMWGRIKVIRDAYREHREVRLAEVLALDPRRSFTTAEYAWCWALCKFLDADPRWGPPFRELHARVNEPDFENHFRESFQSGWSDLIFDWRAFVATVDYGYEATRMAVLHKSPKPIEGEATVDIDASRGWQSTGWLLRSGRQYRLTATGRYQIAADDAPWMCEPGGVTIDYHAGRPLGMLLAAYRGADDQSIAAPIGVGLSHTLRPKRDAIIYLRVNDSPAQLSDNQGTLRVSILPEPTND